MISEFFKWDNLFIVMIFIGSLLAISGAFLLNHKTSQENKILLRKVETSIAKSENAINHITGGDSWCYYDIRLATIVRKDGTLVDKQPLSLVLEHDGVYPIPEIQIKFFEMIPDKTVKNSHHMKTIYESKISWLGMNGFMSEQILDLKLNNNSKTAKYQVNFGAPNGAITQDIIFKKGNDNRWYYATKVERLVVDATNPNENNRRLKKGHPQKLYQVIQKNFPEKKLLGWKDFVVVKTKNKNKL